MATIAEMLTTIEQLDKEKEMYRHALTTAHNTEKELRAQLATLAVPKRWERPPHGMRTDVVGVCIRTGMAPLLLMRNDALHCPYYIGLANWKGPKGQELQPPAAVTSDSIDNIRSTM